MAKRSAIDDEVATDSSPIGLQVAITANVAVVQVRSLPLV